MQMYSDNNFCGQLLVSPLINNVIRYFKQSQGCYDAVFWAFDSLKYVKYGSK